MKKLVLFICLFIFINANSQNYFYSYNSKISIESTDAIVLKNDVNVNNFVVNNNATIVSSNNLYTIVEYSGQKSYNSTVFPVYRTSTGLLLGCTDEIVFSPKSASSLT